MFAVSFPVCIACIRPYTKEPRRTVRYMMGLVRSSLDESFQLDGDNSYISSHNPPIFI